MNSTRLGVLGVVGAKDSGKGPGPRKLEPERRGWCGGEVGNAPHNAKEAKVLINTRALGLGTTLRGRPNRHTQLGPQRMPRQGWPMELSLGTPNPVGEYSHIPGMAGPVLSLGIPARRPLSAFHNQPCGF